MRLTASLIALTLVAGPVLAQPAPDATFAPLLTRLEQAWDHGDGEAWGREFSADADSVGITGNVLHGAGAIGERHTKVFAAAMKGSTLKIRLDKTRMLGRDAAVLDTLQEVDRPNGDVLRVYASWTVERHEHSWRVVHVQNTTVTAPLA